jgi:hypothetical protein
MWEDSLSYELLNYLHERTGDNPGIPRKWRMNVEWFDECANMTDKWGSPLWGFPPRISDEILLLGFPIEITNEATVPELVPVEKDR